MDDTTNMSTYTKTDMSVKRSQLNVKISESLHDELKIYSVRMKRNINEIAEAALTSYLANAGAIIPGNTQIDPSLYKRYVERKEAEKGEPA